MPNITNTLIANVTAQDDASQNVPINKGVGNPSYDSNSADLQQYKSILAADFDIPLPANPSYMLYVKNVDTTKTIIVKFKPTGQAEVQIMTLYPGDLFIYWAKPDPTNTTAGYQQVTLHASADNCLVEWFTGA